MEKDIKNKAILEAILMRFEKQRLPRLLDIKKNVDQGETLSKIDIEFLEQLFEDAKSNQHYLETADDDIKELMMKVIALYQEITEKSLQNEKNN